MDLVLDGISRETADDGAREGVVITLVPHPVAYSRSDEGARHTGGDALAAGVEGLMEDLPTFTAAAAAVVVPVVAAGVAPVVLVFVVVVVMVVVRVAAGLRDGGLVVVVAAIVVVVASYVLVGLVVGRELSVGVGGLGRDVWAGVAVIIVGRGLGPC